MDMIRGTTAQFKFKIPYAESELLWATIKFWQPGNNGTALAPLPLTKKIEPNDNNSAVYELRTSLTAEETLRFSDRLKARVQLRAQTKDGAIFASKVTLVSVYPINDDIVTDNPTLPDSDNLGFIILDGKPIME